MDAVQHDRSSVNANRGLCMKPSTHHQTVTEALQLWRQAECNGHTVGVDRRGDLVYVNTSRHGATSPGIGSAQEALQVLKAKIETELSRFTKSMDEIRNSVVPGQLQSLSRLPARSAIRDLEQEWQRYIKLADPAADAARQQAMQRREQFVERLQPYLPGKLRLSTEDGEVSALVLRPDKAQVAQVLAELDASKFSQIDAATGVTEQLVKDSRRQKLAVRLDAGDGRQMLVPLFHCPVADVTQALQQLYRDALHAGSEGSSSDDELPDAVDAVDEGARHFIATLSRVLDQTLLVRLNDLQYRLQNGDAADGALFNPSDSDTLRTVSIDRAGRICVDIVSVEKWNGFIVQAIAQDAIPVNQGPLWDGPADQSNFGCRLTARLVMEASDLRAGLLKPRFERNPEFALCLSLHWAAIDRKLALR